MAGAPAQGDQRIVVAGHPTIIDAGDGAGPWRDSGLHCAWVDRVGVRVNVDKHGDGAKLQHRRCRRHEGQCRYDHFIAGLNADTAVGALQRRGAVRHRQAIFRVLELREGRFKLPHPGGATLAVVRAAPAPAF